MRELQKLFWTFIKNHKKWFLFMIIFTFFMCLGMILSRHHTATGNIFFGADNARAYTDLIYIKNVSHYRIKVHPLMLILLQPVTLFINGLVHHAATTIILAGSLAGGLNAVGIYDIISRYLKNPLTRLGIVGLYVCSFSTMIFTTIPETFIFASVYLIMFWNFILKHIHDKDALTNKDYIILIFFGITSFGITLTNYVQYLIGLTGLLILNIKSLKTRVKNFIFLNIINVVLILILSKLQQRTWRGDTPFFPNTLTFFNSSLSTYEETLYMNFTVSFDKFKYEIFQTWIYPLIGGDNQIYHTVELGHWIAFTPPDMFRLIFSLIAFICILYLIIRIFMQIKVHRFESILLLSAWIFNLLLHYIYGTYESFMYSPHFFFLPLIILAIGLSTFDNKKIPFIILGLVIVQLTSNLISYYDVLQSTLLILHHQPIPLMRTVAKTLLMGCTFFLLGIWIKNETLKIINIKDTTYQQKILYGITLYTLLIIAVTFWIHVNYRIMN